MNRNDDSDTDPGGFGPLSDRLEPYTNTIAAFLTTALSPVKRDLGMLTDNSGGLHPYARRGILVALVVLISMATPVAAQSEFCDSAFGNLLVAVEGMITSLSISVIGIMAVIGALVWVAGKIVPGGGVVGILIIILAILSFFAMTFGLSFLSFAVEIVGFEHCSTLVD